MRKIEWKPLRVKCPIRSVDLELPETQLKAEEEWESIRSILLDLYQAHPYWIFRGMTNESFELQTSLERKKIDRGFRKVLYQETIERFANSAYQYRDIEYIPSRNELLEIQSLMQHYGTPTILLDWTYSPYIAAYFATNDAFDNRCPSGVLYALNTFAINRTLEAYFRQYKIIEREVIFDRFSETDIFNKIISYPWSTGEGFVIPIEPRRTNNRLKIQQGLFTVNGNIFYSFEENLALLLDFAIKNDPKFDTSQVMRRIVIGSSQKQSIQEDLLLMNITAASLFPGLEGFSKSWNQVMLQKQLRVARFLDTITGRANKLS